MRSGLVVGQFDVPFGIDWHVYPSVDRKLVSVPLVVENTHDCWNDHGVHGYLESQWLSMVLYGTNGFDYQGGEAPDAPVSVATKWALGDRVGVKPGASMEIGGSYVTFFNSGRAQDMTLLGFDLRFH